MNPVLAQAAASLLNAAWQGAALALMVAVALRLLPVKNAALRCAVWSGVFVLAVALHFVPHAAGGSARYHVPASWSVAIAALWIAASTMRGLRLTAAMLRLRGLSRRSTFTGRTVAVPHRRAALLCTSTEIFRPAVLGFFRPRVLIPQAIYDTLTPEELQYILLHETTHLRRRDDWTNLLQQVALVLFPLDPALLWIERRLHIEREFACDDQVVATTRDARSYALCLTSLAERGIFARASSLVLGAWHRRSELVNRVERMLSSRYRPTTRPANWLTGGLVGASLVVVTVGIAHQPQLLSFTTQPIAIADAASSMIAPASIATISGGHMVLASAHLPATTERRPSMRNRAAVRQAARHEARRRAAHFISTATWQMPMDRHSQSTSAAMPLRRTAYPSSSPSEFLPAMAYAVATPDGWILITL